MEFEPVDKSDIKSINTTGKWVKIVRDFKESGMEAAKLTEFKHLNKAYRGLSTASRQSVMGVSVKKRGEVIYLVREDE